jgi:hypothetical protein
VKRDQTGDQQTDEHGAMSDQKEIDEDRSGDKGDKSDQRVRDGAYIAFVASVARHNSTGRPPVSTVPRMAKPRAAS